jgi:hypothetical protein
MTEREYIVTLHKDVDYTAFNQEMIAETGGGDIPQRIVGVENARPASQRNTHYALTKLYAMIQECSMYSYLQKLEQIFRLD